MEKDNKTTISDKYPANKNATVLQADIYIDSAHLPALLADHRFDAVVDFIAYAPGDIERDISLFRDKTDQFVFDNSKIKRLAPDYNCEVDWAEGLRRALAWFEAHPRFQTVDAESNQVWDKIIAGYEKTFP